MLSFDVDDTIVAIASPAGGGLRGVIRLSGANCLSVLASTFDFDGTVSEVCDPSASPAFAGNWSQSPIHQSASIQLDPDNPHLRLVGHLLIWPSRQSYTRQPSAEFHTIGSTPLLAKALRKICENGVRLANPGEFTLRAFLSGRIDLPQAEAILSIIDAQADSQLNVALRQLAGGLSGPLENIRQQLVYLLAEIEAGLDFVEEDIQFTSREEIGRRLSIIEVELTEIASQIKSRSISSPSLRVVLIGLPNSGKSTLFNELLGEQRAIVSHQIGTTTDFLVGQLDLLGIPVELVDTAGFESEASTDDTVTPALHAQRQREQIEAQAHLKLLCIDSSRPLLEWETERIGELTVSDTSTPTILVMTKSDLGMSINFESALSPELLVRLKQSNPIIYTEVPSRNHLDHLRGAMRKQLMQAMQAHNEVVASTLLRTRESLRSAVGLVAHARLAAQDGAGDELFAADLRGALNELGLVVGAIYTDDILDVVFSQFCIGK
jgi:tRNA modification GTPase